MDVNLIFYKIRIVIMKKKLLCKNVKFLKYGSKNLRNLVNKSNNNKNIRYKYSMAYFILNSVFHQDPIWNFCNWLRHVYKNTYKSKYWNFLEFDYSHCAKVICQEYSLYQCVRCLCNSHSIKQFRVIFFVSKRVNNMEQL